MALEVGAVVIDCNDLKRMSEFWGAALGYQVREPADEYWVTLEGGDDSAVSVGLQKVPEPRSGKNRLHLDLYTDDKEGDVERLSRLGASEVDRSNDPEDDFVVLCDPEGNLFCIIVD